MRVAAACAAPMRAAAARHASGAGGKEVVASMQGVGHMIGGRTLFSNVNLSFYSDAKIGILGPNGAGKSTFMRVLAGHDASSAGEVWRRDGKRVGFLEQEPVLDPKKSVRECVDWAGRAPRSPRR